MKLRLLCTQFFKGLAVSPILVVLIEFPFWKYNFSCTVFVCFQVGWRILINGFGKWRAMLL